MVLRTSLVKAEMERKIKKERVSEKREKNASIGVRA